MPNTCEKNVLYHASANLRTRMASVLPLNDTRFMEGGT